MTDKFTVINVEKGMQIKLSGSDGRILLTKIVHGHTESISMENLAAGIYMLQVSKDDVILQTLKIDKK